MIVISYSDEQQFSLESQSFLQQESRPVKIMWLLQVELVKWLFCMIMTYVVV